MNMKIAVMWTLLLAFLAPAMASEVNDVGLAKAIDERATRIINTLPGEWTFTLGTRTSGKRQINALYEGMVLQWSETFDGREVLGDGFLGWDGKNGKFFSMSVHNLAGEYGHMIGTISEFADVIEWSPAVQKDGAQPFRSRFELVNPDEFTSTAMVQDENGEWQARWVATFIRSSSED